MGAIAIAAGVAIVSAAGVAYMFGYERGRRSRKRQVAVAHDVASRIAHDMRTHPHTGDQIRRELLPILTERSRDRGRDA